MVAKGKRNVFVFTLQLHRLDPHWEMDKTFSPSYSPCQITYVEAEVVGFSRFRFCCHKKRTASTSSFRSHIPPLNIARSAGQKVGQKAIAKLTPKSQQILSKLVATPQMSTPNLNNLIAGSRQPSIKIQDLVRRLKKQNKQYILKMSILNITEKPEIDVSIEEYEYHSYEPIAGTNLNNPGEIRLNIETQD